LRPILGNRFTNLRACPEERRACPPRPLRTAAFPFIVAMLLLAGTASPRPSQSQGASSQTPPPSASARSATSSSAPKPPSTAQPTTKKRKKSASAARRQFAPDPARIREIQQALAREGYYTGEPSGKWDEQTVTAMKGF